VLSAVTHRVRRVALCCAGAALLVQTSVAAAQPAPTLVPTLPGAVEPPGTQLADFATGYVGSRYRWGGASPAGFDCTGFVMWVFAQFGVSLPHTEAGQLASGTAVETDDLRAGDVVVFANTYRRGLSHVGIYLGEGRFVHAADERHGVQVSSLWDGYWGPRYVAATRALA
jgi:cell wall-associated NlpC family hydrolase